MTFNVNQNSVNVRLVDVHLMLPGCCEGFRCCLFILCVQKEDSFDWKHHKLKNKDADYYITAKIDVIEWHESGHSNSNIGWHVGMTKSIVHYITKCAVEIKEKGKIPSAFCGLQISTRNRSVTMIETEHILSV